MRYTVQAPGAVVMIRPQAFDEVTQAAQTLTQAGERASGCTFLRECRWATNAEVRLAGFQLVRMISTTRV